MLGGRGAIPPAAEKGNELTPPQAEHGLEHMAGAIFGGTAPSDARWARHLTPRTAIRELRDWG
jgi:hypothetical protein